MILSVDSLGVERGGRLVISNLSFTLGAGEVLLVTGRNGAGKSTLLRVLADLLAYQSGKIGFEPPHAVPAAGERRTSECMHYLGYEDALKPALTIAENLQFWAVMSGGGEPGMTPRDALGAFGMARLIDLPAAYLSAGQKRRVALARLLLNPRPVWLLDEPLIALDRAAQDILTAIMSHHVAQGGAIVAASHAPLGLPARVLDLAQTPIHLAQTPVRGPAAISGELA